MDEGRPSQHVRPHATEECPSGFRLYNQNGIRSCGWTALSSPAGSCQSVNFSSYSIKYSQVCGHVIGYSYGHPDAIFPLTRAYNLNGPYVDCVSITCGNPRKHIWMFMAATIGVHECPCAINNLFTTVPSFIGNDYFYESGCPGYCQGNVNCNDPLWDGKKRGLQNKVCCLIPGLPWFYKTLNYSTTNYIEMRIYGDEPVSTKDCPVAYNELYVK